MCDRRCVPQGAWAGPSLLAGMPIPHVRGAFRFRALLYWCALMIGLMHGESRSKRRSNPRPDEQLSIVIRAARFATNDVLMRLKP